MDEDQVLSAIEATLGQSEAPPAREAQPSAEAAQVEGADAPKEAAEKTEDKTEEPKAEEKAQDAEDVQTIEIDPDEPLFEQELDDDGKKVTQKLSLKELQQGYLRLKDYTKKTQDLARQRDEVPQLIAKQGKELSESYGKRLAEVQALIMKSVAPELNGVDLNKLANEDPFEYVRVSNRVRQIQELLQTVKQEQDAESAKREEQDKKERAERWQKSLEILNKDIPQFGPDVVKRLIDAGQEWGFTREEVSQWDDHRLVKMLHALSEKKAVESKRPEVEKKVAVVTKIMKPGAQQRRPNAFSEAQSRLRKSGRPEDALPIFEALV
jgi:hypothetical protein